MDQEDLLDDDGLERLPFRDGRPGGIRRVPDARLKHLWARLVEDGAAGRHDIFALRDDPSTTWMGTHLLVVHEIGPRPATDTTPARAILASFDGRRVDVGLGRTLSTDKPRQFALSQALIDASGAWSTPRLLRGRLEALAGALGWSLEAEHAAGEQEALDVGPRHGVVWLVCLWQSAARRGSIPHPPAPPRSRWAESIAPVTASARAQGPDFRCLPVEVHARGAFDPTYALLCHTRLGTLDGRSDVTGAAPVSRAVLDLLWAEVLARPADLAPRGVLADAYTALGDPRGSFMQASLRALATGEPAPGERAALRAHERTWLGAMATEAHSPRVWRGGVLAGYDARCIDERKPPRPEWRLLQELRTWISAPRDVGFLSPAWFPSLRVLGLVESTPPWRGTHTAMDVLSALDGLGMMSQLETIVVAVDGGCERIMEGRVDVDIFLVGGQIEKHILRELQGGYDRAAAIMTRMLAASVP